MPTLYLTEDYALVRREGEDYLLVQIPEESRQLDHLLGHETGVRIVEQMQVILAQHNGRRGLGTDDGITFARQLSQATPAEPASITA